MLYNKMQLVRKAKEAIDKDWLQKQEEIREIAVKHYRTSTMYERHERLDLRKLGDATEEEPITLLVKALTDRRTVKTDRMTSPMNVFDVEVLFSSVDTAKAGEKYSIWENTTILASEMEEYAKKYGENGSIEGKTFIIAYYGRKRNKRGQMMYLFRVIPYEDAA